ncbi:F-box only protein 16 isoform X2 [Hyperolius riggenbachi]|uniref:F-box only protein 16 isoform X2 n=1 Tax=Hyperolius riggenbachi TaxID=752182 RepID=UPI0035A31AE6
MPVLPTRWHCCCPCTSSPSWTPGASAAVPRSVCHASTAHKVALLSLYLFSFLDPQSLCRCAQALYSMPALPTRWRCCPCTSSPSWTPGASAAVPRSVCHASTAHKVALLSLYLFSFLDPQSLCRCAQALYSMPALPTRWRCCPCTSSPSWTPGASAAVPRSVLHASTAHRVALLSLYLFSFLDPRSLCRCAQVCMPCQYCPQGGTAVPVPLLLSGPPEPLPMCPGSVLHASTTHRVALLSLYLFSFLDPRSLCRCAQVSWHWKTLTELDQLWMPKCLRFGWYINFSPTPFEQGIWKRQYIKMVNELHVTRPKTPPKDDFVVIDVKPVTREILDTTLSSSLMQRSVSYDKGKSHDKGKRDLPPWRSSDKHPTDTVRYNYLDNFHPIEQARQARKSSAGISTLNKQNTENKKGPSSAAYKLRKVKSLMSLSADFGHNSKGPSRPNWASHPSGEYPANKTTAKSLAQSTEWNAGIRPAPVRAGVPRLSQKGVKASTRTSRSSPTIALFESQPWQIPGTERDSEED